MRLLKSICTFSRIGVYVNGSRSGLELPSIGFLLVMLVMLEGQLSWREQTEI